MQGAGGDHVILLQGFHQLHHLARGDVGGDGDEAVGTGRHQRQRFVVIARQYAEPFGFVADDLADLLIIARGFLHGDDVGNLLGQAESGLCLDVRTRAPGHVIDDDGLVRTAGHGFVVLVQAGLVRLVIVGDDDQESIGIRQLSHALQRGCERIRATAHEQFLARCVLARKLEHPLSFRHAQARRLAGRPERYQEMDAGLDLPADARRERSLVQLPILERREQCRSASFQSKHNLLLL